MTTQAVAPSFNEYKLPDVGEGLTEADIVGWRVKVGDTVAVNDVVVDIETAKSIVELPSPYAGVVLALLAAEGDTVQVGTSIIRIGDPDAAPAPAEGDAGGSTLEVIDTNVPPTGQVTLVGYGPKQSSLKRRARKGVPEAVPPAVAAAVPTPVPTPVPTAAPATVRPVEVEPVASHVARALAKPLVRRLARDLGIDLTRVIPTGPKGTVSKDDVLSAAAGGSPAPQRSVVAGERETREPVKGLRKQMANAMVASAFSAPHATEWVTIDVTGAVDLVARLRERREFAGIKVSPLLIAARACVLAMRHTPLLNSSWDEAAQEVVVKHYVNLGIAAATPRGLLVPNIKDAESLSLVGLASSLEALTTSARDGRTPPADLAGGTFTITNVGVFGVDGGTPILNAGESAILCLGAIRPQPWVVDDQVVPRQVMTLSLSFDHRHIDGALASQFLSDVAGMLEDPGTALLF